MKSFLKKRQEIIQKINTKRKSTRKPAYYDSAIILGEKGGLTRKKIRQIEDRIKKKIEAKTKNSIKLNSTTKVLLKKKSSASATDLATRISLRYLMKPFAHQKNMTLNQKKMLEGIIKYRVHSIEGTQIPIKKYEFLLLNFVNSLGENGYKKAGEYTKLLSKRGKTLKEMATHANTTSDMFYNVYPRVASIEQYYTLNQNLFSTIIIDAITSRTKELNQLKKLNLSQKEKYIQSIEREINEAKRNYVTYRMNNNL